MQSGLRPWIAAAWIAALLVGAPRHLPAVTNLVQSTPQIKAALLNLRAGDTLLIAPGTYVGGNHSATLTGRPSAPITIRGADPRSPPIFQSGSEAFLFSSCSYLRLQHLRLRGFAENGIRIDDRGASNAPSHHIIIEDVTINETGPVGAHDALQLLNAEDFIVRRCQFEGWGGAAIDLIGCRRGFIEECVFIGQDRSEQASGILIRGGSSNVLVQTCYMRWAGQNSISIGGKTAPEDFRPPDATSEASAVTVAGNRIMGSPSPIVWSSVDGGHVHHNTMILPHRWVARILQENTDPRFAPCRNGIFEQNVVLYDQRVSTLFNRTEETAAETFTFRSNAWHRTAGPRPLRLPGRESDSVIQVDPLIAVDGAQALHVTSPDPRLATLGADNYTPLPAPFRLP